MKFFTVAEILNSVFLSAFSGVIFGCVYECFEAILSCTRKILNIFYDVIRVLPLFSRKNVNNIIKNKECVKASAFTGNLYEGTFFFIFGIFFILLLYITLDGIFRVYILATVLIFFVLSKRYLGAPAAKAINKILNSVYTVVFWSVLILFIPPFKLFRLIKGAYMKIASPIKLRKLKKHSKKLISKKISEIQKAVS